KVEVKESAFYRTYNMKSSGGIIIIKPEQLITRYDKRHNKDYTAFYIPENRIIYYSSYGEKGENGKDIYRAHQLGGGEWSEPQALSSKINTPYDEAYPFITPDGQTLYFSSKGHNSMGGYDIFKSTFNSGMFDWMQPENMNFPINTPFDDIFYVPDTANRFASFASTRSSVDGLIYVYKIGIDKKEEQQDFAKILEEGNDVEAAIRLIKDVADMKTNIDISDYKAKMSVLSDSSDISQNAENENDSLKNGVVVGTQQTELNISVDDAVDSTFASYREMKYRIVGLKKQKKSIQRVYLKNKKQAEEIYANMGSEGEREAAKYQSAASAALKIDQELTQEIVNSEWTANKLIELASNMQYYQSNGNKDSVLAIYKKVISLRNETQYDDSYAQKLIDVQHEKVKNKREQASKYYELSESLDKEIESLKSERDEYKAELARTEDEDEKADYEELISGMNAEISKKEALKTEYIDKWKNERTAADHLASQTNYTEKALSDYYKDAENVDFKQKNYLTEADKQEVEQQISKVKTSKPTQAIAVNLSDKPVVAAVTMAAIDKETDIVNEQEVLKGKMPESNKADSSLAVNDLAKDTATSVENEEVDLMETPEAVALLAKVDDEISKITEAKKDNEIKANIALRIGNEKYNEYQKLNNELEAKYADYSLKTDITADEKIKELKQLKEGLLEAEKLKHEAAASFAIAKRYQQNVDANKDLLVQAETKKEKIISNLENNDLENAKSLSEELSNKLQSVSTDVTVKQEKIAVLEKEENKLIYQKDSLTSIISELEGQKKKSEVDSEEYKTLISNIESQKEAIDGLNNKLDIVHSNKQALLQMRIVNSDVLTESNQLTDTSNLQADVVIPEDMRKQDNIVTAFSNQKINRQLKAIDETISEVIVAKEKQQIAEWEATDVTEIPNYVTDEQNNTAKMVVKPRVDAILEVQKKNERIEKQIALSLSSAKEYNKKLKEKSNELKDAYAKIDTSISLKQQSELIDEIRELEKEQLLLNQKQEAAMQYANILNKERNENNQHIESLSQEVVKAKTFIANKQLDSAINLSQQAEMLASMMKSTDFLDAYLEAYRDENKLLDEKINQLSNSSNNNSELDSLRALKSQNTMVMSMIREQSEYVNDEQKLAQVDSSMIVRSKEVPIVAINSDIFNPNYLQSHSVLEDLESKENIADTALAETDIIKAEQLGEAVITANRVNKEELVYIKRELVNREIQSIVNEIRVLTKIQEESLDKAEIQRIDSVIIVLNNDKKAYSEELDALNKQINKIESKAYVSHFDAKELDVERLLADLAIMKDSLNESARKHRQEAENLKGKSRKEALAKAKNDESIAFEIGLASVDIVAKQNNVNYHENSAKIASKLSNSETGFATEEALSYSRKASENQAAAAERRKQLAENIYSKEEQEMIVAEAEKYENLAIENQQKLLQIIEGGAVVAQNNNSNKRTAEEIPFDEKDDLEKEKNQELAAQNENKDKGNELIVVPVLTPSKDSAFVQNVVEEKDSNLIADNNSLAAKEENISREENQELAANESEVQNANELVVVPVLTPSKDSALAKKPVEEKATEQELTQQEVDKNATYYSANNSLLKSKDFGIKTNLSTNNEIVNTKEQIPDNEDLLPMGLVFKVQMAAFKRRMPASTFPGISPIAAEKIPNSSFIRYVGGIFPNYNYAITARNAIRAKGFKDAFIVAYFDGRRISIAQARRLIKEGKAYTSDGLVQFAIRNNTAYYKLSENKEELAVNNKTTLGIPSIEEMQQSDEKQDFSNVSSKGMGIELNTKVDDNQVIDEGRKLDGLVFKVQIEALRNEVPLNYFKGISPVVKEKHAGSDLTYYVAGSFPNYISAAKARDQIHDKGFPAAFIVVYFNGQRISIEDANQLIKNGKAFTTASLAKYAVENNMKYYPAKSKVSGLSLYYSVQIGVFGGPRSASQLHNLSGLYFNRTKKGYYRYFSGKYSSEQIAKSSRDQIRQIGIKDAFVVAFQNGKRISLFSARKLEADARTKNISINRNGAVSKANVNAAAKTQQNEVVVADANAENGIVFKVQLGAYKGKRNSTQLKLINSMSENGISSYTTSKGLTIYFTNSYKNYQEAKAAQGRIRAAGHKDVFVVALQNGRKINIRKALEITGQK
ncbi:MAG: hypothetical protein DSY76_00475, partial [Bacteroidetes bacterium]